MEKEARVGLAGMGATSLPSTLSTTVRRVLLWGVPSLAVLGLAGLVGWRWLRSQVTNSCTHSCRPPRPSTSTGSTSSPTTCSRCDSASFPERSPASEDSGVVEDGSQGQSSGKNSEAEEADLPSSNSHPSTPRTQHRLGNQLRRSSNLALESEAPLKQLEAIPSIENESYSETDSASSSEGLLSLPSKSPTEAVTMEGAKEPHPTPTASTQSPANSDNTKDVSKPESSAETKNTPATTTTTTTTANGSRKDRVRVMLHIPRGLVGRFIGKQGRNIKALMVESKGAHVYVNQKNIPSDSQSILCTFQGTLEQVEEAVRIVEAKYPEIDIPASALLGIRGGGGGGGGYDSSPQYISPFPCPLFSAPASNDEDPWGVELRPAVIPPDPFSATASFIEGVTDLWLVTWEKCMEVDRMHSSMSYMYKRLYPDSGHLAATTASATGEQSQPVKGGEAEDLLGKFCAVRVSNLHWLRGRVARLGDCSDSYEVQLVDYGSMVLVPSSSVKPLRREYSLLPVQAFKCRIAHVECKNSKTVQEGMVCLQQLLDGQMMEVHVTATQTFSEEEQEKEEENSVNQPGSAQESSKPSLAGVVGTPAKDQPDPLFFPSAIPTPTASDNQSHETGPEAATATAAAASPVATPLSAEATPTSVSSPPTTPKLPPLAPHIPVVELYVQQGAQTPTFVNRELVELGYAAWKEERLVKPLAIQKALSLDS